MLNFFGPVNRLGTGIHCFNLAKAYEKLGKNDICLIPPNGSVSFTNHYVDRWLNNRMQFSPKDPSIMIFDMPFMTQFSGNPRIGFCVFESDKLRALDCAMIDSCDYILTPSSWGKEVLEVHGFSKVFIVPEGYDPLAFPVCDPPNNDSVTFIHIGKYEMRKGSLQVIECFANALEGKDATLIMHITNPFVADYSEVSELIERLNFSTADGRNFRRIGLKIEFTQSTDEPLSWLYKRADCGIFPSKGEGFGLPILECIVSGVPAIVGRWTAMKDYISDVDYPTELLIKDAPKKIAEDGIWFRGDKGSWYVPASEELIGIIKYAYENIRGLRGTKEWKDSVQFARWFTWHNAARKLDEVLTKVVR